MNIIPVELKLLQRMPISPPDAEADKDSRGRVLILAGSSVSPGAPLLTGEAALRSGAGDSAGRAQEARRRSVGSLGFLARGLLPLFPRLMDGAGVIGCRA